MGWHRVIMTLLLAAVSFGYLGEAQAAEQQTEYFDVSPAVTMAKHGFGSNMTCIALEDGLYFIDCGMSTELSAGFRRDMEEKYGKKAAGLIITHAHLDHILGMDAFSDVPVIAADTGRELWKQQLSVEFTEARIASLTKIFPRFDEAIKTARLREPTRWFSEKEALGKGKNKIVITNTGGHTADSSSVYFIKEKVLVAGDLVQADQYPYFGDPTTDMAKWQRAFKKWGSMAIKKVCPGHGRVSEKKFVRTMDAYFTALEKSLKKLKKRNVPVEEAVAHEDLPAGYWPKEIPKPIWFDYCVASLFEKL